MGHEKISRRSFLQLAGAAAAGTLVLPNVFGNLGPVAQRLEADGAFEAYHNVTAAQHQANFDRLGGQGYRLTSLSVYGDPSDPRYAAVWVQRSGPDWVGVHGLNGSDYQAYFDKWSAAGYAPVIVTATGPLDSAVFAAVYEKDPSYGPWKARHNISLTDFNNENASAAAAGQYLRSMSVYGTSTDRRYTGVWHNDTNGYVRWFYHDADPAANYQQTFDTEAGVRQYRLAYVALSADQTYASVFTDQWVGPWAARHGMTSDDYQAEFDKQNAAGLRPIVVQGGRRGRRSALRRDLRPAGLARSVRGAV